MSGAGGNGRRREVLAVLRAAEEPLSIVEVADRVGVHPNTARLHLDALEERGQVERTDPPARAVGRPALHYRAVPGMDPEGPRSYRLLAEVLVDSLSAGGRTRERSLAAGRSFGRRLAAGSSSTGREGSIRRLVAMMDGVGFAPRRRTAAGETQVVLHHCPFLELADDRRDVICPVHLGLMQGALAELGGAVTVESLEPFVEPDRCLARLGG